MVNSTNPEAKTKGVSIAFHKSIPYQLIDSRIDSNGRFIFLKVLLFDKIYTIANFYAPNHDQAKSGKNFLCALGDYAEGALLVGGDFNLPLCPLLDTSSGRSSISYTKLNAFKKALTDLQLVDAWRLQHGPTRDYTFFSSAHGSYSRIDYLFISHHGLSWDPQTLIGPSLWSDHSPIYLLVTLPGLYRPQWTWRLNDALLTDAVSHAHFKEAILNFLKDHATDDTPLPFQWEALKCVLRGVGIQQGARLKRDRAADIKATLTSLQILERQHKEAPSNVTLLQLTDLRTKLLGLYSQSSLRYRNRCRVAQYEYGNKCGKALARALHPRTALTYIPPLKIRLMY